MHILCVRVASATWSSCAMRAAAEPPVRHAAKRAAAGDLELGLQSAARRLQHRCAPYLR